MFIKKAPNTTLSIFSVFKVKIIPYTLKNIFFPSLVKTPLQNGHSNSFSYGLATKLSKKSLFDI